MDRITGQAALLALCRGSRSDWGAVADRVEASGNAYELLMGDERRGELFHDGPTPAERLDAERAAIAAWTAEGIRLVTVLDEDYPAQLRALHQRPPFLFYRGTLDARDAHGVAVVGSRDPSEAGTRTAAEIAEALARRGTPVVGGLAAGIETAAHRAALEAGGRTVAVIGTGLHCSYPAQNADLQEELGRSHLVLSQFWPAAVPTATSFPMRNAVLSAYAAATVVVEAVGKNDARARAHLALQHGRPVFLLESLLQQDWAREYAQWPSASVVSGSADILDLLSTSVPV